MCPEEITESNSEVSQAPSEPTSTPETSSAAPKESSTPEGQQTKTQTETSVPYDRFKEVIEQKNEYAKSVQDLQARLDALEKQAKPVTPAQEDALLKELKAVNPEFAARFEKMQTATSRLEQLESDWKASQANQTKEMVTSQLTRLHDDAKVPKELRDFYESQITKIATGNPKLGIKDLPAVYKEVHDRMSKFLDQRDREKTASYVEGKKKDASVPATSKGQKTDNAPKKAEWSKDESTRRQQLVDRIRNHMKAEEL